MPSRPLRKSPNQAFNQSFDTPGDRHKVACMSAVAGDSKVATKQRLIEAAEDLFADEGFDRVSVRDLTT